MSAPLRAFVVDDSPTNRFDWSLVVVFAKTRGAARWAAARRVLGDWGAAPLRLRVRRCPELDEGIVVDEVILDVPDLLAMTGRHYDTLARYMVGQS